MVPAYKKARAYHSYMVELRRFFHEYPELSYQEFNTCAKIRAELDSMGIPWRVCGYKTGTIATITGDKPGKTILLRGDIDALTVPEETGLPYASRVQGVMHACGHDAHTAMLLTAARILMDMKKELHGTVQLAFQPGEEICQGAKDMVADHALDGVDGCFAIHIWSPIPSGRIAAQPGVRMASSDYFKIDVQGKGSHCGVPHRGIDAAVTTSAIVSNLQTLVSREWDPLKPAVVNVGFIQVGDRFNVTPESAHIEGTVRCCDHNMWEESPEKITRIVMQTAEVFRATATVEYKRHVLPTINNEAMTKLVNEAAIKLAGEEVLYDYEQTMGGEDFSEFLNQCPGCLAFVGIGDPELGTDVSHHSRHFKVDENALDLGTALYVQVAQDFNAGQ